MYNVRRLQSLAFSGLRAMAEAVFAFGRDPASHRFFQRAWGFWPWAGLFTAAMFAGLGGEWIEGRWPDHRFADYVYWPLVLFAVIAAWRVRTVLYEGHASETGGHAVAEDRLQARFNGLAVPLIAGGLLVLLAAFISRIWHAGGLSWPEALPEQVLAAAAASDRLLGLAAALAIGVASLSFRRRWVRAGCDLAIRLFVFGILVGVTVQVLEAIRPFSSVFAFVYEFLVADRLPAAARRILDGVGNAALTSIIYLGLLGGVWTVAKRNFRELLDSGDVDLLAALNRQVRGASEGPAKRSEVAEPDPDAPAS